MWLMDTQSKFKQAGGSSPVHHSLPLPWHLSPAACYSEQVGFPIISAGLRCIAENTCRSGDVRLREGGEGIVLCQKITFQLEHLCGRYTVLLRTPAWPLWLWRPIPPTADSLGPDYYPRTVQSGKGESSQLLEGTYLPLLQATWWRGFWWCVPDSTKLIQKFLTLYDSFCPNKSPVGL